MRLYDEMDTLMAQPAGESKKKQSMWEGALGFLPKAVDGFHADIKKGLLRAALLRAGMLNKVAERVAPRLSGGCLAILGFEGREAPLVEAEAALGHAEYLAAGGRDLGEELGLSWFENRYAVSYKQSVIYVSGGFVDTMEVATTWDRLLDLYHEVRRALAPLALVLAHFSHVYPQGCSIYFTIAASATGRMKTETLYDEIWQQGLAAVLKAGGTISHHHGIGVSKAAFMKDELGSALSIYRQLKAALDPQGILNPGKMGL
jgi:alkyldihydroxyacetonephosphate synthase